VDLKNLKSNEYISSYNFARIADKVYAESLTFNQYELIKNNNTKIISKSENQVLYINTNFLIKENDVIFCNTYMIKSLFEVLRNVKNLTNIKLITTQTDHLITEELFLSKPLCISEWYAVNVGFVHKKLIPIPLGLANKYSEKNLQIEDFINQKITSAKKNIIYSNFQINTNYQHRKKVLRNLKFNNSATIAEPNLRNDEYKKNLLSYNFIVCPWGNGIDSHRVWESLYSNSIPIIFEHATFKTLNNLPKIKISNLKQLRSPSLISQFVDEQFNFEKLNILWWESIIRNKKIKNSNTFQFDNVSELENIKSNYKRILKNEHNKKIPKTLFRKIDNKINKFVR
tara:strand:- start:6859 stop:7884 length:1026 start_codon:yes stop_codon:yes gene_type:complete